MSTLVFGGFKQIKPILNHIYIYVHPFWALFPNYTVSVQCWLHIKHVNVFCFPKPNSAPLSCPGICFLFPSSVCLSCLLSKDFQLHNFQSQGRQLGANSNGKQHQNHLVSFALNVKKKSFDRKNYKALENKVNHCGRMPGVDKWRDRNVSTTSAICFLCCEFFSLLCPHSSLSLPYFPAFSVIYLCSPCSSVSTAFSYVYCFFFFLFISVSFSLSHPLSFLSKILFVRCQRSRKAGCELRESVITNNTQQKRLI